MARPRKRKALGAWMHGLPVGRWEQASNGEHRFRYAPEWLAHPEACPVSLSMPLRGGAPYRGAVVEAWFGHVAPHGGPTTLGPLQLLPEGQAPGRSDNLAPQPPDDHAPPGNARLCTRIAAAFGLPDDMSPRMPHESLCQALGTPAARKYEIDGGPGAKRIMDLLLGSMYAGRDRLLFLQAMVVSWMLCATNMHAGHYSIAIEPQGRFRLASIHGPVSAWPDAGPNATMAMAAIGDGPLHAWGDIQPRHWLSTAQACGADAGAMRRILEQLVEDAPGVVSGVQSTLPVDCPDAVADPILRGVERSTRRLAHWLTRS